MPKFSNTSKDKLSTCHQDLQKLFNEVIKYYDCTIVCGHRNKEDQDYAYAIGHSEKRWPDSKHNTSPSLAVDVAPYELNSIDWGKTQTSYFAGFVKGVHAVLYETNIITHRLRMGIDWDSDNDIDDTKFLDACHFELISNKII
jgi:peptidoglycan L-alanyl-D-glutamate endopeptidase CwlK